MTDNVTELPITRVPPAFVDPVVERIELSIFRAIAETIDFEKSDRLHHACGLAEARHVYLREHLVGPGGQPWPLYIADVTTVIRRLSKRQREKLRHPALDRQGAQQILDGDK